ncbi:MAG TPA: von Willebrand factor type A domain-containing protein [Anaerolineae bacterium]|nr:von Willebrand factor type A domain-containing protein [Anaerolineae bacterium]
MNARRLLALGLVIALLVSACGAPAPTSAPPGYNPPPPWSGGQAPAPTSAPQPTAAPFYSEAPSATGESRASSDYLDQGGDIAWPPPPYPTPWPEPPSRDTGVNPFVDTREDHLSTFAMDVDTAAYTQMRDYLNSGSLPPADLVRVEEFINYFNMDYPDPQEGAFSINLEGARSPFGGEGTYLLKVGLQGKHIAGWERKDALLTFVIDVSGSMEEENRIGMVKYGLNRLVDQLGPNDRVAIVAYSDTAWVVLDPTSVENRSRILDAINGLYPMNSTNTEAGLRLGYELAWRNYRDGAINRVILCSDGVANVGNTDPNVLATYAQDYYGRNIFLSTVGVGHGNYNDQLLEQLADKGNGVYAFLDSDAAAERIFSQNLEGTLQTIAKDAKIQVDFNPYAVRGYRLLGYENRAVADYDFRNDTVDAGEVGAGHSVTALYEVQLQPEGSGDVVVVRVRYEDPDTHAVAELNKNFGRTEFQGDFNRAAPRFQLAAAVAQFAEILRYSSWAQGEKMVDVWNLARNAQLQLPFDADVAEFVGLVERAGNLMR